MEFIDLKLQYKILKQDIDRRIETVLNHGIYIMGPEVSQLEENLAEYVGVNHVITCANGTDALQLALMALKIGPGDAVFTTPFTFYATSEAISVLGAKPVFVDIDPDTYNIDAQKLRASVEQVHREGRFSPKAVIPVDLFGLPADYDTLLPIAAELGLQVIEDAAQGFGGAIGHRRAGSFGSIATTSFFPAKPLGCYGDGGALFTNDDVLAATLKSLRIHGKGRDKYDNERIGLNSRLDAIQAAVLLAKLEAFPAELQARQRIANAYSEQLAGIVKTPTVPSDFTSAWAQYTIRFPEEIRDIVQKKLSAAGVPTNIYYPIPLHMQTVYADFGHKEGSFPQSEIASRTVLSLPMHPYMSLEDVNFITTTINKAMKD